MYMGFDSVLATQPSATPEHPHPDVSSQVSQTASVNSFIFVSPLLLWRDN